MATRTSGDFPVGTSYWRWPLRNSPIARACATSSPACVRYKASCITWGSAAKSRARLWPTRTNPTTGVSSPIFAQVLIAIARPLHACDLMGVDLHQSLYALDSTTIDLCLSLFPWAKFRPCVHDVNILDEIMPEAGAFYVMDRAYIDFQRLFVFTLSSAFFVVRTKSNVLLQRRYSHPVDKSTGVLSDQTVILSSLQSATAYPDTLRKVSYFDTERSKRLKFLTNNFTLPAQTIAGLYKQRWQVELFFKWIKQHLRIKAFYGTSENAVKTQIWIAVSIYVLVAIVRKRLELEASLYQILQILSVTLFEKTPILRALQNSNSPSDLLDHSNQLILFNL